jgi:hypothetical protein
MNSTINITFPASFENLSLYKKERIYEIINKLHSSKLILGVLWGGSLSYKNDPSSKADVDLFCLVKNADEYIEILKNEWRNDKEISMVLSHGYFPWTGELYGIYFKGDNDFGIDICLISLNKASTFFWEPNGHILWDEGSIINDSRKTQQENPQYTNQPFLKSNPFSLSVVTAKKIEKNLARVHLWNALELLSILRKYVMQIIRIYEIRDTQFLGRVNRDIEEVFSSEMNKSFIETIATYDVKDIAIRTTKLLLMLDSFLIYFDKNKEGDIQEWVKDEIENEIEKLKLYISSNA